jgi:hypothetical protein
MDSGAVFGKVTAQIQFIHSGADGTPLAQAFHFIDMDDVRFGLFLVALRLAGSA